MNTLKTTALRLFLILLGLVIPFLLLEVGLRIENRIVKGTPLGLNPGDKWDTYLGWPGKEHLFEPLSEKPVLVIGDSFTHGLDVASEQMWFAQLTKRYPGRGLIAYGGLGYGTLQQLRVLQRYHAQGVHPSLVVLQLCSNDILNNLFKLEKESLLQRPPGPRPYLEGNAVTLRFPRDNDWLLLPLVSVSRFAYRTSSRWDGVVAQRARSGEFHSVEFNIQREGFSFEPFREAIHVTQILLDLFKQEMGSTSLVLMLVDDIEPYSTALKDVSRKLDIPLVIPARAAPLSPSDRLPDGTHLNEKGNEHVGRAFIELASKRGSLPELE